METSVGGYSQGDQDPHGFLILVPGHVDSSTTHQDQGTRASYGWDFWWEKHRYISHRIHSTSIVWGGMDAQKSCLVYDPRFVSVIATSEPWMAYGHDTDSSVLGCDLHGSIYPSKPIVGGSWVHLIISPFELWHTACRQLKYQLRHEANDLAIAAIPYWVRNILTIGSYVQASYLTVISMSLVRGVVPWLLSISIHLGPSHLVQQSQLFFSEGRYPMDTEDLARWQWIFSSNTKARRWVGCCFCCFWMRDGRWMTIGMTCGFKKKT